MNVRHRVVFIVAFATIFATAARASTFTVTNVNDSGAGSLRQAILDANSHANSGGADVISFAISGAGVHTIAPTSALPMITDPVIIDGTTQGVSATPLIELNCTSVGTYGLWITAGGSTVRHLAINRAPRSGIYLTGSGGNLIEGNFVGTDPSGTIARANLEFGVFIDGSPNNLIGGTTNAARNIVSGNTQFAGIGIGGSSASNNMVQGNFIGTDVTGAVALGNGNNGVYLGTTSGAAGSPSNCTVGGTTAGAGNLISGNGGNGIEIYGPDASGNLVQGNFIGTNASGTAKIGNHDDGVNIGDANGGHTIGGTALAARNIISGNGTGVHIVAYGTVLQSANNIVQGNYIGTDVTGAAAVGNTGNGVYLESANNNTIGGSEAGAGNVISGNAGDGVFVQGIAAANNQISGNLIGRNAANNGALGNTKHGAYFIGSGPNIIGGGFNANNANVIAHNVQAGVAIVFANGASILKGVLSNSIFSNGGLGIDLGDDGLTPNDPGDADTGANTLQNFPVLTSAVATGVATIVSGTLNSTANTAFRLEFFSNEMADPSGHGEGQNFLGTQNVTTDGNGNVSFSVALPLAPVGQKIITATATDASNMANTSEFSNAVQVFGTRDKLENLSSRMRVLTGDNILIAGFIITGTAPMQTLIRSSGPSMSVNNVPVPGALQDPTLSLRDANGAEIEFNDNWGDAPEPERTLIANSGKAPADPREPAIERTLLPGLYTAIVRGKDDSTGIAMAEVFDLGVQISSRVEPNGLAATYRLTNISARGFCSTANNVMIGGTIVGNGGGGGGHVLIRGMGPSLSVKGVPVAGRMMDPILELHDANGVTLIANNDWKTTQQDEIAATGMAPGDDKEAALMTILPPGVSTVILKGNGGDTGIALIEIYELPEAIPPAKSN